ncbi:Serine hydrolase [Sulfidibacter corallicola]|uniref:Serine hydrolase n=1 Tax=Sulfidibacter corallicola TaxID=2818388 RepID=A0A8A4TR19_SULCO|nr:serine hydrolase [Sulfidibacter corallicola]QTD52419.1 serine hydrolase [Sulfidibacter corallicola]
MIFRKAIRMGLILFAVSPAVGGPPEIPEDLQNLLRRSVESKKIPSMVVGIVNPQGKSVLSFGRTQPDGAEVDGDTLYEIGSVTKIFTSALLADMVAQGKMGLNDPIDRYLPEGFQAPRKEDVAITLTHLATHRSGLPRLPENMVVTGNDPYVDYDRQKLHEAVRDQTLLTTPGKQWAYSNFGMGLLGDLIAQTNRTTYEDLVLSRICKPLGMNDTVMTLSERQSRRLAAPHDLSGTRSHSWHFQALAGAGALRSSANDMLRFLEAHLGLADAPNLPFLSETHTPRADIDAKVKTGLGWMILKTESETLWFHDGQTGGYSAFLGFNAKTRTGVVVLANQLTELNPLGLHLLNPKNPAPSFADETTGIELPGELLQGYTGHYQLSPNRFMHVTLRKNQLFGQLTGQPALPMFAESETKFFNRQVAAELVFENGSDGSVAALVLHQGGATIRMARMPADFTPPGPPEEIQLGTEVLKQYEGQYKLFNGGVFTVRLDESGLVVQLTGQPFFPVFAQKKDVFFYKVVDAQLHFERDEKGEVVSLVLHQNGMKMPAKRK